MQTTTPFTTENITSVEALDEKARELATQWDKSFSSAPKFDGKKRNALRDLTARLAGFPNGYQQFLAYLDTLSIPTTEQQFDLPDKLIVKTRPWGFEDEVLIGTPQRDNELLCTDDEHHLYTIFSEDEEDLLSEYENIRDIPVWQYICEHYLATGVDVIMPRIEKYGVDETSTDKGALALIQDLYLTEDKGMFMANAIDRGDDGSTWAFIELKRKA